MLNAKTGTRGSRGFSSRLAESKPGGMLHNASVQKMASRCTLLHEQAFYHKYNRGKKKKKKLSAASSFKKDTFKKTDTYNLLHAFVNSSRRATHNIQNCTKSGVTPAASEHYDS